LATTITPMTSITRRSRRVTGSAAGIDENGMTPASIGNAAVGGR